MRGTVAKKLRKMCSVKNINSQRTYERGTFSPTIRVKDADIKRYKRAKWLYMHSEERWKIA